MSETNSEIQQGVTRVQTAVSDAHANLDVLEKQITPVLDQIPEEAPKALQDVIVDSPLGGSLHGIGQDIETLVTRLRRLTSRIKL